MSDRANFSYGDIVVYNGIIAEWSLVKMFVDINITNKIRKADKEEIDRWLKR